MTIDIVTEKLGDSKFREKAGIWILYLVQEYITFTFGGESKRYPDPLAVVGSSTIIVWTRRDCKGVAALAGDLLGGVS